MQIIELRVVVDVSMLEIRPGRNSTGIVYMTDGWRHFPMDKWDDFVAVLVPTWAGEVLRLMSGARAIVTLMFNDLLQ